MATYNKAEIPGEHIEDRLPPFKANLNRSSTSKGYRQNSNQTW